jgi:hypothetical protein
MGDEANLLSSTFDVSIDHRFINADAQIED